MNSIAIMTQQGSRPELRGIDPVDPWQPDFLKARMVTVVKRRKNKAEVLFEKKEKQADIAYSAQKVLQFGLIINVQ